MKNLFKFIVGRKPEIFVYQAIYETFKKTKFPIENKKQFIDQICTINNKDRLDSLRLFALEFLPAYLFPMSDLTNALEKISEIVETRLYDSPFSTENNLPQKIKAVRYTPHPSDPNCEFRCHITHAMEIMDIMEAGLQGGNVLDGTLSSIGRLKKCLYECKEAHLPIEP